MKPKPKRTPAHRHIHIVRRAASSLRLHEWRASEAMVAEAQKILNNPRFQIWLDMLRNESPLNYGLPAIGVATDDRLVHQAKCEGYQLCLNNIEASAILHVEQNPIEATFEDPEPPQE